MFRSVILFAVMMVSVAFAGAQVPAVNMDIARGYILGPGDEVTGKVNGEDDFDFVSTVDEDGRIEVPFSDKPIDAKCMTVRQLRAAIIEVLKKYLRNPQLGLSLTQRKSRPPATVYGEVKTQTQIELLRRATLVEVLAQAGGVTDDAGGTVQVFRTQPPLCIAPDDEARWVSTSDDPTDVPSRTYSLSNVRAGKDDSNPVIFPGDVVWVLKASPVYITGEVFAPQGIYLKEGGMTLTEALAKIGGPRPEAQKKDIKIHRLRANSKDRDIISANYDQIIKGLQADVMLEPYDIVIVDKAKDSLAKSILNLAIGAGKATVGSLSGGVGYRILY